MLATVIRGPSCWKLASLSSKGFSVLITGSVLETEQSIQTSCWDGCFQLPDHPACVLFSIASGFFCVLVSCLAFGILVP